MSEIKKYDISIDTLQSAQVGVHLDLGIQSFDHILELENGVGPLALQVCSIVEQTAANLEVSNQTEIVPVVLLYRREDCDYFVVGGAAAAVPQI